MLSRHAPGTSAGARARSIAVSRLGPAAVAACSRCGYDLSVATEAMCPECGSGTFRGLRVWTDGRHELGAIIALSIGAGAGVAGLWFAFLFGVTGVVRRTLTFPAPIWMTLGFAVVNVASLIVLMLTLHAATRFTTLRVHRAVRLVCAGTASIASWQTAWTLLRDTGLLEVGF